jgi:hypothetical protein
VPYDVNNFILCFMGGFAAVTATGQLLERKYRLTPRTILLWLSCGWLLTLAASLMLLFL